MQLLSLVPAGLVTADWSIESLLENGQKVGEGIGGGILTLMGLVGIVMSVIFFVSKLLSEQSRRGWGTIIVLFIAGGLCLTGGIYLFMEMASGFQTSIEQLGTGAILLGFSG